MARRFLLTAALALATSALFGACKASDTAGNMSAATAASAPKPAAKPAATATATATPAQTEDVRRVSVEELQKLIKGGRVAIYDTRAKAQYEQEHIPGALSLPQGEAEARAGELPRDKTLVFYCTWPAEQSSAGAARILKTKGITDTAALVGGMDAWKKAGLPTEKK